MIGGPISGALLGLHGLPGLEGWRWLFIIEGIPAVLLGIVALGFLTDRPKDADWLRRRSGARLKSGLRQRRTRRELMAMQGGIGRALTHPRVIELGLLYFCIVVGLYGIGFWMPQVLQIFGLSNLTIGFLTAIAYFDCRYWHGDRRPPLR